MSLSHSGTLPENSFGSGIALENYNFHECREIFEMNTEVRIENER